MKKVCIFLFVLFLFSPLNVKGQELIPNAKSGLLMDVATGKIIFEKDIDSKYAVASMTKMMSQILILEAIDSGILAWDKIVKVSKNAADFGGSQIYLQAGEEMSVRNIFKGISMASANDGTVALAEEVAGSEEEFVKMMNNKAKKLGLKNTIFKNSTGLDQEGHFSSSRDMAKIARYLINNHPEILEYSKVYEDYLREDTPNKFWLVNTNKLVRFYEGADGLKTGHTNNAGYCMAVTSKRNNMRLLAIVLGEESSKIRNKETADLLDYGFNNYKINVLKHKGEIIDKRKIEKGNIENINIVLKDDLVELLKKNEKVNKYKFKSYINFKMPVKKGGIIGKIEVIDNDKIITSGSLTVNYNLNKINYFNLYFKCIKNIICGF